MSKFITIFSFILLSMNIHAQQNYFSKRFSFGYAENGQKILQNGSGYDLILGAGIGNSVKSVFIRLDSVGNFVLEKIHGMDFYNYLSGGYGALIKLSDSSYAYTGSVIDTTGQVDALLYKLSKDGDSVWIKQYGDSLFQSGWQCRQTRDGGFIICGQSGPSSDATVWIAKIDSSGNLLWQNNYGGSDYDIAVSLDTCYDGGFIICGATTSFGVGAGSQFENGYVIKTDSNGNTRWSKVFGDIYDDGFWNCLQSKDGNYVFSGHYTYYDPFYPTTCCQSYSKPFIIKLDTAGNTVWDKKYGAVVFNTSLFSIKELANGDLIATGWIYDSTVAHQRGLIIRINSQGDSLWYRDYENLHGQYSDSYLYDITPTSDGGFIAIGFVYPIAPDTGYEDTWVLKIDSNGCEVANCLINSAGEIVEMRAKEVDIFPNPSSGIFNLRNNTIQEIDNIEVYNSLGQIVFVRSGITNEINIKSEEDGIYLYRVTMRSGKIVDGKILKQ